MALDVVLLLDIALILIFAKILGEIAERLHVSPMVGEVIAGLILGPLLLVVKPNAFLEQVAGFGILFLLFLIGLNTRFDDIKKDVYKGSLLAVSGALLSFVAGFLVGYFIFNNVNVGIFFGVAVLSTSTAITLRSLADIGEVKTRIYEVALAVDMADEVIAILALSLLTTYFTFGVVHLWAVVALFFIVIGFFLAILTVGSRAISRFLELFKVVHDEHMIVAIPLVIIFAVAFLSEQVGIAGVTGAFLAGMAMSRSDLTESVIRPRISTIGHGFFIPLFFAYSAIIMDLSALQANIGIVVLLVVVASAAKMIGIGWLSKFFRFAKREQRLLGVSMIPRGEYAIVISQLALIAAIITQQVYTIMIAFIVITIVITPILLKLVTKVRDF
jgi:Kef-type K+ transport system membrane component KefB